MSSAQLQAAEWAQKLSILRDRCEYADAEEAQGLARALFGIVRRAPAKIQRVLGQTSNHMEFNKLVDEGSLETALLQLYGQKMGYILSSGGNNVAVVTIKWPEVLEETTFVGPTPAIALIGCLTQALSSNTSSADFQTSSCASKSALH